MPQMPRPKAPLGPALLLGGLCPSTHHWLLKPETADICLLLDTGPGWLEGLWDHTRSVWGDELQDVTSWPVCASSFLRPPSPPPAQQVTFPSSTSLLLKATLHVAVTHPQETSTYLSWSSLLSCPQTPGPGPSHLSPDTYAGPYAPGPQRDQVGRHALCRVSGLGEPASGGLLASLYSVHNHRKLWCPLYCLYDSQGKSLNSKKNHKSVQRKTEKM